MALSTTLLLAVLGGLTYEAAGREQGLTRTAVERRVKALVLRLLHEVGIEGLNESGAMFVRKLREHREAIEAALARYVPVEDSPGVAGPVVLSDDDIQNALRRVRRRTPTPERDMAMVWILLATGMRPLEVARMEVADYLNADGSVRIRSQVRASVAENGLPRPLYFSSAAARDAIDDYLATRCGQVERGRPASVPADPAYRGLAPGAPLFLAQEGRAFLIESIPSVSGSRSLCQEIHYAYRKIFRRIGIPGLSALKVRYTVIDRLLRRGADKREIGELLGVRELRPPTRLRPGLDELMDGLV
ncbi:MAG: site-specific integrase [Acidovorax sp.]